MSRDYQRIANENWRVSKFEGYEKKVEELSKRERQWQRWKQASYMHFLVFWFFTKKKKKNHLKNLSSYR